jgi:hypothetical protein
MDAYLDNITKVKCRKVSNMGNPVQAKRSWGYGNSR